MLWVMIFVFLNSKSFFLFPQLVERALRQYKNNQDPGNTILEFYREDKNSISAFFARAVLDTLLQYSKQECKIN